MLSTVGNLNNFLGVPLTLLRIDPHRHQFAVIEAGISLVGEMDGLAEMIDDGSGVDHLDKFRRLCHPGHPQYRLPIEVSPRRRPK